MSRRFVYVVYGESARRCAEESISSLKQCNSEPITVVGDRQIKGVDYLGFDSVDRGGRWAKMNLDSLIKEDHVCYLDADTKINGDLSGGFSFVENGWDMALTFSASQGQQHLSERDREATRRALGIVATKHALALQCGVLYFARNEAVKRLFTAWREEWQRFGTLDQGAFLRALNRAPVKLWLLGRCWNGGKADLVYHRFGRAVSR